MDKKLGKASEFLIDALDRLPRVDVIYAHANMSADLIDAAIRNGAKGIVVAGWRRQHDHTGARCAHQAAKGGVVVVRSSRLPSGITLRNNEVNDDEKGFVASGELNPAKSRVLAAARADEVEGPGGDPEDVLRVLSSRS